MLAISKTGLVFCLSVAIIAAQGTTGEGVAAFQAGRFSTAAKILRDVRDPKGQCFYALTQAALGDCRSALPGLTTVSEADPLLHRMARLAAVKCFSSQGEDASAFSVLQDLEKRYPNDPDVLYTAAKLPMKAFNDATLRMFQRTPASYRVHELSAELFEVENRFADAVAEYRKAIELNPKAPDLHFRLGRAMLLQNHDAKSLDQAAAEFISELKLSPEDSASEFQLGQIALVKGEVPEAKQRFHQAIALSPGFVSALIALGKISSREKDYTGAIDLLGRAVKLQPDNETAHYALMTAYRDSGQMKEAKAEKATLDRLQKPPEGEFSDFLKKLGEKPNSQ